LGFAGLLLSFDNNGKRTEPIRIRVKDMTTDLYIHESAILYDAIVVGSGMTGGWAAKEFCERGMQTLMIERGRVVEHRKDYITEGKGPWEFENRTKVDNLLTEEIYSTQKNVTPSVI
jgi:hypothetical protein